MFGSNGCTSASVMACYKYSVLSLILLLCSVIIKYFPVSAILLRNRFNTSRRRVDNSNFCRKIFDFIFSHCRLLENYFFQDTVLEISWSYYQPIRIQEICLSLYRMTSYTRQVLIILDNQVLVIGYTFGYLNKTIKHCLVLIKI